MLYFLQVIQDYRKGGLNLRPAVEAAPLSEQGELRLLSNYHSAGLSSTSSLETVDPTSPSTTEATASMPATSNAADQENSDSSLAAKPADDDSSASFATNHEFSSKELSAMLEKKLFPPVPKRLTSLTGQAICDYHMIRDGDRVLLGLSGGKDSLTMLHVLHAMQKRAPIKFELAAVTMNPNFTGFDPTPLIPYMKSLGIPYFFESQQLLEEAQKCDPKSICSWCSRMKRKIQYFLVERTFTLLEGLL